MDTLYQPIGRMWVRDRWLVTAALGIWALILACGWLSMTHFAYKVDQAAEASPLIWPHASNLPRRSDFSQLVVFVHPLCPCSKATLAELERLLSRELTATAPPYDVVVAVVTPRHADAAWTDSPLVQRIEHLNRVQLFFDAGGVEADRFGAVTSGTILYYDSGGRCRYHGGITQSRGHEGDNPGEFAIAELLAGREATGKSLPPFGCRLVHEPQPSRTESSNSPSGRTS